MFLLRRLSNFFSETVDDLRAIAYSFDQLKSQLWKFHTFKGTVFSGHANYIDVQNLSSFGYCYRYLTPKSFVSLESVLLSCKCCEANFSQCLELANCT